MNKYKCESCGANLREVGLYTKTYNNYIFDKENIKFIQMDDDLEGYMCRECDEYVDIDSKDIL